MAHKKSKLKKAYRINVETLEITDCEVGDYRSMVERETAQTAS